MKYGAGRPKGAPNKATAEIKALAQTHTADALETLVTVMPDSNAPAAARVAAANAMLDRGHGKPTATVEVRRSPLDAVLDDMSPEELRALEAALSEVQTRH